MKVVVWLNNNWFKWHIKLLNFRKPDDDVVYNFC